MLRSTLFDSNQSDGAFEKLVEQNGWPSVYHAGAMFNEGEKYVNQLMAEALEKEGFEVFLPQRDGFEFGLLYSKMVELGLTPKQAEKVLASVIFDYDAFQVMRTDLTVYNNEGRTPDEGAVSENALGWGAMGKRAVFYSTDLRSLLNGANNPLVTGLSTFKFAKTREEAIEQLKQNYIIFKQENPENLAERVEKLRPAPKQAYQNGEVIHALKMAGKSNLEIAEKAIGIYCPDHLAHNLQNNCMIP